MPSSSSRAWTIRGVSDRTREAVLDAALAADLTVGEWIDRALGRAAEEARHPKPPAATRDDVAELLDARLKPLEAALAQLAGQPPRPRGGGRPRGPARANVRGEAAQEGKAPGKRRQRLTEPVRARIEELHEAGRTVYAISKELGVPYSTVRTHVKALGERAPS
jgi:hypothetical protein